ncbi:hypothetical protein F4777DRAFT_165319 [Nemania sp. FL0916]|nr:hypothetical protein F4777DRAFT_165319 [Nemania sp. FL0916]
MYLYMCVCVIVVSVGVSAGVSICIDLRGAWLVMVGSLELTMDGCVRFMGWRTETVRQAWSIYGCYLMELYGVLWYRAVCTRKRVEEMGQDWRTGVGDNKRGPE